MDIKLQDINLSYEESGNGDTCLFLHGSRDRKEVFRYLFPYMLDYLHLVSLDLRGHGNSDKPTTGYDYDQFVQDIQNFLDYRKIGHLTVIGHSLGSVLAILLASQLNNRVDKLVLMGTHSHFKPKFKRPDIGDDIDQDTVEKVNAAAAPFFFLPQYKEVQDEIITNWSQLPVHVHKNLIKMGHPDLREEITKISIPTLLIFGDKDKVAPYEERVFLNEKIHCSKLVTIPDAGHFMFMEQPEIVAKEILSFLGI